MDISLNPEFRKAFGMELIPLATDCLNTSQLLIDMGHEQIRQRREFVKKICSPQEFEESLKIYVEVAKEKISSCYVHVIETDVASDNYASPLLEKLRQQRNQSGFDRQWLTNGAEETWRYEIIPTKRLVGQAFSSDLFQQEIKVNKQRGKAAIELENERIFIDTRFANIALREEYSAKFYAKFMDISNNEVSAIGFLPSKKLSKPPNLLQYTKAVSESAHLRLAFVMSPTSFRARLFLAENNLGRKFDGNWNEWYSSKCAHEIRLWDIIPWFSYRFCFDVSSLLVNFFAYMSALKLGIDNVLMALMRASGTSNK